MGSNLNCQWPRPSLSGKDTLSRAENLKENQFRMALKLVCCHYLSKPNKLKIHLLVCVGVNGEESCLIKTKKKAKWEGGRKTPIAQLEGKIEKLLILFTNITFIYAHINDFNRPHISYLNGGDWSRRKNSTYHHLHKFRPIGSYTNNGYFGPKTKSIYLGQIQEHSAAFVLVQVIPYDHGLTQIKH